MEIKDSTLLYIATLIIMALMMLATCQNRIIDKLKHIPTDTTIITKHDTQYVTKTFTDTLTIPKVKYVHTRDTFYKTNDTVPKVMTLLTKTYENNIVQDSDTVNYKAYIKGYTIDDEDYPRLDSIKLKYSHRIINTYTTTTIQKQSQEKGRKWHISPSFGLGYGITTKKCDAYLGFSIGYYY